MKNWKVVLPAAAILLLAGQALAQNEDKESEERLRETEEREVAMEEKLRDAEARLAEAAREIAEITKERLPRIAEIEKRYEWSSKPRLGITIEGDDKSEPVEGVTILAVTPGSAAADAGLRSGDVITSIDDEALNSESSEEANGKLIDVMKGVEEGDVLKVEYLRDGKIGLVEVEPRIMANNTFFWAGKDAPAPLHMPNPPAAPHVVEHMKMEFGFPWTRPGLGDLELVELNEGLGRYFGTDKGILVVKAPGTGGFDLKDGDVIQSIDGREPKDVRHALRILGSYQAGEKLKLGIMRDKKKVTVDVEIPADQHGRFAPVPDVEIRPAAAPAPSVVVPLPDSPDAPAVIVDISS